MILSWIYAINCLLLIVLIVTDKMPPEAGENIDTIAILLAAGIISVCNRLNRIIKNLERKNDG